jgi:hypothetical protein
MILALYRQAEVEKVETDDLAVGDEGEAVRRSEEVKVAPGVVSARGKVYLVSSLDDHLVLLTSLCPRGGDPR